MNEQLRVFLMNSFMGLSCVCVQAHDYKREEFSNYHAQLTSRQIPAKTKAERFSGFVEGKLQIELPRWWTLRLLYSENGIPTEFDENDVSDDAVLKHYIEDRLPSYRYEVVVLDGEFEIKRKGRLTSAWGNWIKGGQIGEDKKSVFDLLEVNEDTGVFASFASSRTIRVISVNRGSSPNWTREVSFKSNFARIVNGPMMPSCIEILWCRESFVVLGMTQFESMICVLNPDNGDPIFEFSIEHFDGSF